MDNWIAIPPLTGPEGVQTAAYAPWGFIVGRCMVTNKAAHPDVAFRLCDLMYSTEATMRNVFGVEGTDWVTPPEGELSIDGGQAAYRTLGHWDADITDDALAAVRDHLSYQRLPSEPVGSRSIRRSAALRRFERDAALRAAA